MNRFSLNGKKRNIYIYPPLVNSDSIILSPSYIKIGLIKCFLDINL